MGCSKLRTFLFLVLSGILTACSGPDSDPGTRSPDIDSPRSLTEIFQSANPVEDYIRAYRAFIFTSEAVLKTEPRVGGEGGMTFPPQTLTGRTELTVDDHGNYRFLRRPWASDLFVELLYHDRSYFLRQRPDAQFRRVHHQSEFNLWLTGAFREVFTVLESQGFFNLSPTSSSDARTCRKAEDGFLCVDTAHGLPLEAELTMPVRDRGELKVRFRAGPLPPGTKKIEPPPPPAS